MEKYKQLACYRDYSNKIDETSTKWFKTHFSVLILISIIFLLLLRKEVYSYEYTDEWEKARLHKAPMHEKEDFYKKLPLTKKELKLHQNTVACYNCWNKSQKSSIFITIIKTFGSIAILHVSIEVQHIVYLISHLVCIRKFGQNESNYHYCFIIKELVNKFKRQFESLQEVTEKYKTFSVPIEKKLLKLVMIVIKVLHLYLPKN